MSVEAVQGVQLSNHALGSIQTVDTHATDQIVVSERIDSTELNELQLQFQDALNGNVVFTDRGDLLRAAGKDMTPKEAVMNSIQNVQDKFQEIETHLAQMTYKNQDFSSQDLLMIQYDLLQLNYICELSTKTADKSSNAAQTLFRNQG